jgi:hypothetical protein
MNFKEYIKNSVVYKLLSGKKVYGINIFDIGLFCILILIITNLYMDHMDRLNLIKKNDCPECKPCKPCASITNKDFMKEYLYKMYEQGQLKINENKTNYR